MDIAQENQGSTVHVHVPLFVISVHYTSTYMYMYMYMYALDVIYCGEGLGRSTAGFGQVDFHARIIKQSYFVDTSSPIHNIHVHVHVPYMYILMKVQVICTSF